MPSKSRKKEHKREMTELVNFLFPLKEGDLVEFLEDIKATPLGVSVNSLSPNVSRGTWGIVARIEEDWVRIYIGFEPYSIVLRQKLARKILRRIGV